MYISRCKLVLAHGPFVTPLLSVDMNNGVLMLM